MILDKIALILAIIGGLNWGSIGLFQFDFVAALFGGQDSAFSRVIFALVGLAALWCISLLFRDTARNKKPRPSEQEGLDFFYALPYTTPQGGVNRMMADEKKVLRLLKTARGQMDGIIKMVEENRYCIDISQQLMATEAILNRANKEILAAHLKHCAQEAASDAERGQKIDEFVSTLGRTLKKGRPLNPHAY